jgi:hypothetical protein
MIGEDDEVLLSPFKGFYHSPHEPVTREMGDIPEDSERIVPVISRGRGGNNRMKEGTFAFSALRGPIHEEEKL